MLTTFANANKATFEINDAKLYVPVVTLSTEDFKRKDLKDQSIGTNIR